MAPPPDTRSQDRFAEIEQRLELHQATIASVQSHLNQHSQDISDLKDTASRLEDLMKNISVPISTIGRSMGKQSAAEGGSSSTGSPYIPPFGSFHEMHRPSDSYSIPTKQSRVEFPRFDGSDFRGWAYRCRQFFEVDGTPPEHRIRLLSIHLEGHALLWHQTFMRRRSFSEVHWDDYYKHMEEKFSTVREESPLIALKKLTQADGLVSEYETKFDELLSEVDIPEEVAVSLFIGGLRPDIQQFVLNSAPVSLAGATYSARLQEVSIRTLHENAPIRARGPSSSPSGTFGQSPAS